MSSTHSAMCGNSDETSIPHWPYFRNCQREDSSGVSPLVNWLGTLPKLSGSCCPSYFFNDGFGSNVSMWLGAPTMNRKMTDLAFAGKCCGLGARGFTRIAAMPSRSSKYCSASAPKPWAARVNTSRRVMAGRMWPTASFSESLRGINELVAIKKRQAEIRKISAGCQELPAKFHLDRLGRARQRQLICAPQLEPAVSPAFTLEPCCQPVRLLTHEVAVK